MFAPTRSIPFPVALALGCAFTASAVVAPGGVGAEVLAVEGATLHDGLGSPPLPDAVVLVLDGRIVAAGPAERVAVPPTATRIDARGRHLVPGFVETHAHLAVGAVSFSVEDGVPVPSVAPEPELPSLTLRAKRADMVLLTADPTRDIRASRSIEWVMKEGALYRPADLLADLDAARRAAVAPPRER